MPPGAVLDRASITKLLKAEPPLIEGYIDLSFQLQPNGFDLTLQRIERFISPGRVDLSNARRTLPTSQTLEIPEEGLALSPGPYLVTFNEVINLPLNVMALAKPRSSLLRCGVAVHNAVWDAGYRGRSQALLVVYNPHGFTVYPQARLIQLVFFKLAQRSDRGYSGRFQSENL